MPPAARFASRLPSPQYGSFWLIALLVAVGVGATLRLSGLGTKSFWLDETFSTALVRTPWPTFLYQLRTREANSALYYLILRPWIRFGQDEATIRLLGALFGILTIPVVGVLGRRLFGQTAGIAAAFVLAFDPFHLLLSQEARGYPLATLLVACSTWAFCHVVTSTDEFAPDVGAAFTSGTRPDSIARWVWCLGYIVASVGALYSHFYSAFVLVAQCASLVVRPRERTAWSQLALCWIAVAIGASPLGWFLLSGSHTNIDWIAAATPAALQYLHHTALIPVAAVAAIVYGAAVLGLLSLASRVVRSADRMRERWAYILVVLWLLTPIAIPLAISVTLKPVLEPRYLAVSIPALSLLAGSVIARATRVGHVAPAVALIVATEAFGDWAYFTQLHREDWRATVAMIGGSAQPGDAAIFYAPYVRRAYDYYAARQNSSTTLPSIAYPSAGYSSFELRDTAARSLDQAVLRVQREASRTWLIVSHANADSACRRNLDAALLSVYRSRHDTVFAGIQVRLYGEPTVPSRTINKPGRTDSLSAAIATTCEQR